WQRYDLRPKFLRHFQTGSKLFSLTRCGRLDQRFQHEPSITRGVLLLSVETDGALSSELRVATHQEAIADVRNSTAPRPLPHLKIGRLHRKHFASLKMIQEAHG